MPENETTPVKMVKGYTVLTCPDWPMGGEKKGVAHFTVEAKGKRQRVARTTTYNGRTAAPKRLTYGEAAVIFMGDDGRTYPAVRGSYTAHWTIYDSGMKVAYRHVSATTDREEHKHLETLARNAHNENVAD